MPIEGLAVALDPVDAAALAEFYGPEFLEYALNGHSLEPAESEPPLVANARSTLWAIMAASAADESHANRRLRAMMMLAMVQPNRLNLAQTIRSGVGGELPAVESADPLIAPLTRLAHAAFPLLTIPEAQDQRWFGISMDLRMTIFGNPFNREALAAIVSDEDLSKLFPRANDSLPEDLDSALYDISAETLWSSGSGGGIQLVSVPSVALEYVYTRMRLGGDDVGSVDAAVGTVVELMRKLVRDRRATVPLIVGLSNIQLPPSVTVPLRGGRLVAAGCLEGFTPAVDSSTSVLLVLDTELSLLDVITPDASGKVQDGALMRRIEHRATAIGAAMRALNREIVRVRLAIALASPSSEHYAPIVRARWLPNPFGGGGWSGSLGTVSISPNTIIDESGARSIDEWSHRLSRLPDSMWLGARRLVGAIADRTDPLDSFVDAVVCWENLLGAEAEITFRLCSGLAWLLEPENSESRSALYAELKELYGVRSGLVHGSREPTDKKAAEYRARSIEVALLAMRAIFDRPELLEARTSSERNRRVLIGA